MKTLIYLFLFIIMATSSFGQYSYEIIAEGRGACSFSNTNQIRGTFQGITNILTSTGGTFKTTVLSGSYSSPINGLLTVIGSCPCNGEPNCSGTATYSNPGFSIPLPIGPNYCTEIFVGSVSVSNYYLTIDLLVYKSSLAQPQPTVLPDQCGSSITLTTSETLQSYGWQAAKGSAVTFIPVKTTSIPSTTITQSDLVNAGFSNPSGQFFFRYRNIGCTKTVISPSTGGVQFNDPPPVATAIGIQPSCSGLSDGKIQVTSLNGSASSFRLTLQKREIDGTFQPFGNQLIATKPFPLPIVFNISTGHSINSGSYKVIIENNSGLGSCSITIDINVSDPPPITILPGFLVTNMSCHPNDVGAHNNGVIQLSIQNGMAPYAYEMNTGSGFIPAFPNNSSTQSPIFSSLSPGTFQFKTSYQNPTTGVVCQSNVISGIVLTEPNPLNLSSLKTDNLCLGKNHGLINTTVSGGNGGYNFNWTATGPYEPYSIPSFEDPADLFAGDYSLTVTDSKGCSNATPLSVLITEPVLPLIVNATIPSRLLFGGFDMSCALNDGIIELDLENEAVPVSTYSWTKDGSPFIPSSFTYAENLAPGNYSVTIIDGNNCDATTSIALNAHPGITANTKATSDFNGFNTKCPDTNEGAGLVETVTNGFGALSYTWFDGSTDQFIDDLLPGNYLVNVIDGNGCRDDATLIITPPPAIQPNIQILSNYNGESISCPGADDGIMEAFPINGFGSYSYLWDHGPTTKAINGLSQNVYAVTVTDAYGCSIKNSLLINDPATMQLNLAKRSYNGSDLSCKDDANGEIQLTVINGIAPYDYAWSEGSNSQNISGLSAGDYIVSVTDQNGCSQTNQTTIINPDELVIDMQHPNDFNGFDITCNGLSNGSASAFMTGGTAPYSYVWSGGQGTEIISGQAAGDYTVQILDANNCATDGSITLIEPPPLQANASIDNPVSCFGGSDGQISVQGTGGAGTHLFSLGGTGYQVSNVFAGLDIGVKNLFIKDGNGCVAPIQKTMIQPDALAISFQNIIDAKCNDPVGSAQAVVTGGNGGYNFRWFDNLTNQPMNTGDVLTNAIASVYRVEVVDAKNCPATELVAVSSIGGAIFDVINVRGVTCFGFSDGSAEIDVTSGITPFSYLWSDSQTQPIASNLKAGNYFASVIDGLGCKTIKPLSIITPNPLSANYSKTLPNCVGDCDGVINAVALGGTQPYQYNWTSLSNATSIVNGLCKGDYNLMITDNNNCVFEELVNLPDPEKLGIAGNFTRPICLGRCDGSIEAIGQGGTGPYQFQWQDGPASPLYASLCPGDYNVTLTDAHGCSTANVLALLEGDPLPIDLGGEATLCVGQSKVLDAGNNWSTINWTSTNNFVSNNPIISISNPGSYFLKVIDAIGCIGLDTFKLETSLDLLKAEFIMPSEVIIGDTLVAIDISWPLPDKVEWDYPTSFTVLPSENPDFLFAIIQEAGAFKIGMRSFLAECKDFREKDLMVLNAAKENNSGRLGFKDDLVQQFSVYPNPNDGRFDVNVLLNEEKEVELMVINFPTGAVEAHYSGASMDLHQIPFDLSSLSQGLYFILLRVEGEQHALRFVKK